MSAEADTGTWMDRPAVAVATPRPAPAGAENSTALPSLMALLVFGAMAGPATGVAS